MDGAHVEPTTTGSGEAQSIPASGGTLMFSNHLSSQHYRPTDDPTRDWSLRGCSVADRRTQQRILRSILHLQRGGITALGVQCGSERFVIVDYDAAADKGQAKKVVLSVHPHAKTFAGHKQQMRSVSS